MGDDGVSGYGDVQMEKVWGKRQASKGAKTMEWNSRSNGSNETSIYGVRGLKGLKDTGCNI